MNKRLRHIDVGGCDYFVFNSRGRLTEYNVNARGCCEHEWGSSFISDATGYAIQHLQYLPFGEAFVDQQAGTFDSRYKFSAKEKDDETQYSYFGARYYDSDLSVWLSVDPLSHRYPSTSSYMYVKGNPLNLIDPNGMSAIGPDEWDVCIMRDGTVDVTWKSNKGGDETQIVNVSYENSDGGHVSTGNTAVVDVGTKTFERASNAIENYTNGEPVVKTQSKYVKNKKSKSDNDYYAAATAISVALLADDASIILTIDDLLIPFIYAGAYILDQWSGGFGDSDDWVCEYQPPSENPINRMPKGFDPNKPDPDSFNKLVKWFYRGILYYELYEINKQMNEDAKRPTPKDNNQTLQPTPSNR